MTSLEGNSACKAIHGNWKLFSLYHSKLLKQFKEKTGNINEIYKSVINTIYKNGFLQNIEELSKINGTEMLPAIFRVEEKIYKIEDRSLNLVAVQLFSQTSEFKKPAVKLKIKGLLSFSLNHFLKEGEILIILGKDLGANGFEFKFWPEKDEFKLTCINLKEQTKEMEENPFGQIVSFEIPICDGWTTYLCGNIYNKSLQPKLVVNQELVRCLHTKTQKGKKQKSLNKPKDDDDVNIHDQQPKNKRKRSVLEEKMKNLEQQPVELDLVSTSKVIRLTQENHQGTSRTLELIPSNVQLQNLEEVNFSALIESGLFVPGPCRPKVKNKNEGYKYSTLVDIDKKLKTEVMNEIKNGKVPKMMLGERVNAYVFVDKVFSSNTIDNPKYRLVVSDETMENVPMRICSWNDYNEKRPSIKEGDVIRVHRVLAQVEHDCTLGEKVMVLSTAPLYNYTIFYLENNKLICDTIAKNVTYHTETDFPRLKSIFKFKAEKIEKAKKIEEFKILAELEFQNLLSDNVNLNETWDGNTIEN